MCSRSNLASGRTGSRAKPPCSIWRPTRRVHRVPTTTWWCYLKHGSPTCPATCRAFPKVIFNQNAFYSFGLSGACDNRTLDLYRHRDIQAVVTVSNDSRDLLIEGCGIPSEKLLCTDQRHRSQALSCTGGETPARGVSGPQTRGSRPQGGADGQSAPKAEAPELPGTAQDAARGGSQRPAGSLAVSQLRPSRRLRSAVG